MSESSISMSEVERIRQENRRRAREVAPDLYSLTEPETLYRVHQLDRAALTALRRERFFPLGGKTILEIGCGGALWLSTFELWGAKRKDLAGIDLNKGAIDNLRRQFSADRDEQGRLLSPGADFRCGNAAELPWADNSFDLVLQSTVLTSILDADMKRAVASEMMRVVKEDGIILWYDFLYNNPRNPNVRGIGRREICSLFPGTDIRLRRVTLAPPLSRRIVPWTWFGAMMLEGFRFLNSHYLGIIRKKV
jgi:ubiquinone/menaquinone biosynthesis C-methylase UbiE